MVSIFSRVFLLRATLVLSACVPSLGGGQATPAAPAIRASSLILVNSEAEDVLRADQLRGGVERGQSLLLRSASSLTPSLAADSSGWRASVIAPQFLFVSNTKLPFSQNNGALWAGKGSSSRSLIGFRLESPRVRLIVAPEIVASSNRDWPLRLPIYIPAAPPLLPGRSPFSFPYYVDEFSIDQPLRFGDKQVRRFDPGQSSLLVSARRLQFGFSNENEWWGPGIRNAIVLSNNAPGFPHLLVRTAAPIDTRFGALEMRWLVGGLTESRFFDSVSTNDTRSLASLAFALQTKWDPNLNFGFARSVFSTATGWGQVPWRWFDVFARTSRTASSSVKKDQLFSLFARWVFPAEGLEVYTEWGRTRLTPSLRDLLVKPNHTQGYTLGLQWRGAEWHSGTFRLQTEVTQLEQSATWRDEPGPSWYASDRVIQGYTNRGAVLGASIGPGASSQWLAIDYLSPSWRFGGYLGRIRWNEDVHSNAKLPVYVAYCSHDVSIYPGIRAAVEGRWGFLSADLSLQNRLNAFFQNDGGCPNIGARVDIRNRTLSITFSPFSPR